MSKNNFKNGKVFHKMKDVQTPPLWCQFDTGVQYLSWKVNQAIFIHAPGDTSRIYLELSYDWDNYSTSKKEHLKRDTNQ